MSNPQLCPEIALSPLHLDLSRLPKALLGLNCEPGTVSKLFNSLVAPILLYNCEIWGAFMNNKKLQRVDPFVEKMFDDKNKHELLQLEMANIALGVHKKSNNMAVRGELGLYPLNIDIYIRMIKYFLHLKDLVIKGNKVIEDGITESINLVRNRHECWLTAALFIFKTVGIDFDLNQLANA